MLLTKRLQISVLLAAGVVVSSLNSRPNFYSATVYISQSNACLLILTNLGFFLTFLVCRMIQIILFGQLRTIEVDRLYERIWLAVTESFLAMTIFRDVFDFKFVVMFTTLMALKVFHWLANERVEFVEQGLLSSPYLFHFRLISSLILIDLIDFWMVSYCLDQIMNKGPSMMIIFGFEFAILCTTAFAISARYALDVYELRYLSLHEDEEVWEGRGTWIFVLDIITDFTKLVIYFCFLCLIVMSYAFPLHILRDVYITLRTFVTRIRDFIRYRRATASMNNRYADATEDELQSQNVCIICREEMELHPDQPERSKPKKLPCGHILHFGCLKSWLERQQRCPTCRRPVLEVNNNNNNTNQWTGADVRAQNVNHPNENVRRPPPEQVLPQEIPGPDLFVNPNGDQVTDDSVRTDNGNFVAEMPLLATSDGIIIPAGYKLPPNWSVYPVRYSEQGIMEIEISPNEWISLPQNNEARENNNDDDDEKLALSVDGALNELIETAENSKIIVSEPKSINMEKRINKLQDIQNNIQSILEKLRNRNNNNNNNTNDIKSSECPGGNSSQEASSSSHHISPDTVQETVMDPVDEKNSSL